jgi:transposase
LLAEFGIVIPQGIRSIMKQMPSILEDEENGLPGVMRDLMRRLTEHLKVLDTLVAELEQQIQLWHRDNEASRKLEAIPGIGPITASAIVATIGNAREFNSGRQLAAWLGLVPRQHSSGGKPTLLGISKRGDAYLRTLLIHGARSVIRVAETRMDGDSWLRKLMARRNRNVASVALANKNARIIWALLVREQSFQSDYATASGLVSA